MSGPRSMRDGSSLLVVDDDRSIRDVLADGLGALGYRVATAENAGKAMEALQAGEFRLVLTDIDMPGENGIELLRKIKSSDPDVDVIMVTGVVDVDTAIGAIRQGASDYVTKPFNLAEVGLVVERTLEKRRLILENRAYQQHLEDMVAARTAELAQKKEEVEALYRQLESSYESTLQALVTALDYRDNETQGHSRRVVEYAVLLAGKIGVREPELSWVRRGAILHDVGKIGVPDAVLKKAGPLDPQEWEQMRKHPEMGHAMLRHVAFLRPALDIVLCHQERWDGSGYPRGLKGEEIPLGARIFAVVDTFDAMTSDRPYRSALSIREAREEIRRFSGIQFDPIVAETFLSIPERVWKEIRERVHREAGSFGTRRVPTLFSF